ncbi:MAG: hypothetical protein ACRCYZ_03590 [Alphaproteobacteria bacterium]
MTTVSNLTSLIFFAAQNEFKKVSKNTRALNPAFMPPFEKKFRQIPTEENGFFIERIFSALRRERAQKSIQHLVFDNVPWGQIPFEIFSPLLKELQNLKILEFRQTVVESELLKDLLSHSITLENLSFSSCFMRHDFLNKIEAVPSRLKKLSISQIGFFENPPGNCTADSIPSGLTELSLSSCYRVAIDQRFLHEDNFESYLIRKIGRSSIGIKWLAERALKFVNLERLTVREPEICLENLASYPVDKIFDLAPQLNFFEWSSCYHDEWRQEKEIQEKEIELDHLIFAQYCKKRFFNFLLGFSSIFWERSTNSLTFETDDAFLLNRKSRPKVLLAKDNFFELSKKTLDEEETKKAIKNFESLIGKFRGIDLIRLSEKDFFALKLKEYLEKGNIKVEFIDLTQEPIPDYVVVTCSKRAQMGFNVFEQGTAVYDPDVCKYMALKYNLSEQEVKKKFEDGTIDELFKHAFQNVEDLAEYLIKKLNLFLFTAEELRKAQERLGYYPASNLAFPYIIYSKDPLPNSEIPIEFIELFSSDFNNLPDFVDFTKEYLIKREDHTREILNYPPTEISPTLLHQLVIAYLFPSPCQLLPLLKVQERAKRVARAILGLEESEAEPMEVE